MDTKEKIIKTAQKLFNDKGSYSVTTRHIAAAMNISPGNFYYHFRNKEEIIRALLDNMITEFNSFIRPSEQNRNIAAQFIEALSSTSKIMYDYRFFFMEIYTLLEKDQVLKKTYMKIKHERDRDFKKLFMYIEQSGMISESINDEELSIIIENAWTLSEFLLPSMYIDRIKITPENILKKFYHVMYIVRPYLKKEFRELIK